MTLYDKQIQQIKSLLPEGRRLSQRREKIRQTDKNTVILMRDAAYELGGSQKPCVSALAVTSEMKFSDSVFLSGRDICEISSDCPFAKVVFIEIVDIDEESAFDKIKQLENVRYNFGVQGIMARASALNMREQLRISKATVKSGVSFGDYGAALIDEYKKNPLVKSVDIHFVTDSADFNALYEAAEKIKSTTDALNHILDNVVFDCSSCNLKPICDEVDGMKELHMKKAKKSM